MHSPIPRTHVQYRCQQSPNEVSFNFLVCIPTIAIPTRPMVLDLTLLDVKYAHAPNVHDLYGSLTQPEVSLR